MFGSESDAGDADCQRANPESIQEPVSTLRDSRVPPLEGEPDQIAIDTEMIPLFQLDSGLPRADAAGHFPSCHWVIAESKSKGHIAKALEQLRSTYDQARARGFDVEYLALVYENLGSERRLFIVRQRKGGLNVLFNRRIGATGPVTIGDKEVIALRPADIALMYRQKRIPEER